jgi:DNA-binding ferritin-like protein (Dps family)
MTKNIIELLVGSLDDKKQWKEYRARVKALPAPYRESAEAVERYLMASGNIPSDGARMLTMFDDLADLFEQAAADGTPVRDVVGEDPVEFVGEFVKTYSDGGWIGKEQARLARAIEKAEGGTADAGEKES